MSDAHDPEGTAITAFRPGRHSQPRDRSAERPTLSRARSFWAWLFFCALPVGGFRGGPAILHPYRPHPVHQRRARPFPVEVPYPFHAAGSRSSTSRREAFVGNIAAWKLEPVGDGYRLKNRKAGQYAALAEWAKRTDDAKRKGGRQAGLLHLVSDPAAAATWNVGAFPAACT